MTKQIDIKELIPYLKQGWVAMDKNGRWYWFEGKPIPEEENGVWIVDVPYLWDGIDFTFTFAFDVELKPVENWTQSLIKVENKDE